MYKRPSFKTGVDGLRELIDYGLDEEARQLVQTVRGFAAERIAPQGNSIDREKQIPRELVRELGEMGLLGIFVPEKYGGSGLSQLDLARMIEEISWADASVGVLASVQNSLVEWVILTFGSEEQKKKFLPRLSSGERIGCYSLSEPGSGSDAAGMICKCEKRGSVWVITGEKNWITNGREAFDGGVGILFATMDPTLREKDPGSRHKAICAFIVDFSDTRGISLGKAEDKLGIRGSSTVSINYDEAEIPAENLLTESGKGFHIAMATLDGGRIGIGAQALGITRRALEESILYANQRVAFGKPIKEFGALQVRLSEMASRYNGDRLAVHQAARLKDQERDCGLAASMAKLRASRTAVEAAEMAVQIHGGAGYTTEYVVERLYRDAKITEIYEGTTEIQQLVIATRLFG